jgi:hypothetical protein
MEKGNRLQIELDMDRLIRSVIIFCLVAQAIILFLDICLNLAQFWYVQKFKGLRDLSNAALENSFGTWFSIVQNFSVAVAALVIALHYRFRSIQRFKFFGWLLITLFFAYISLDDHLVLHERMGGSMPVFVSWLTGKKIVNLPTYGWIFLFGPLFGAFGIFFLIFLYTQLGRWRYKLILIAALSLWVMAVLMDAWDGTSEPYNWVEKTTGFGEASLRHTSMLVEEILEMLGSTAFLYLFLTRIRALNTKV